VVSKARHGLRRLGSVEGFSVASNIQHTAPEMSEQPIYDFQDVMETVEQGISRFSPWDLADLWRRVDDEVERRCLRSHVAFQ
jgi:hypothetical protein